MRVLAAFVAVVVVAQPTDVFACACCDGHTQIEAVAWSASGGSVLLQTEHVAACELSRFLSVRRTGATKAIGCYDLRGDPDKRIACNDVAEGAWSPPKPAKSKALSWFPTKAVPLAADVVRVRAELKPGTDQNSWHIIGDGRAGGVWKKVWTGRIVRSTKGEAANARAIPHVVKIYQAPGRKRALVLVGGSYVSPDIGHFTTEQAWITLPSDLERGKVVDSDAVRQAVPLFGRRVQAAAVAAAQRYNGIGLAKHRKGKFAAAIDDFTYALYQDSRNPMARYNLACALARLGLKNRAIDQLAELAAAKCKKCPARLKRAKVDPDLASLRADPRFRALTK